MRYFLSRNLIFIAIVILGVILRFNDLGETPPHLNWDEASNGYNAFSILHTGKDENGNLMPVMFRSFGDYNLALSVYTLVPSIAVFGLNQFSVRFPSAFFGSMAILLTYSIAYCLFKKKSIAILSSFFLAISPWHLQFSRYDHEANFMLTLSLAGLAIFLKRKDLVGLLLSALFFGLALNTYHGAKIWVPVFLLILILTNFRKIRLKNVILPALVFSFFVLPLLFNFEKSLIRGKSIGVLGSSNVARDLFGNYLSHFSLNFLFTNGDTIGRHSVKGMGQLYLFEFPIVLLGLLWVLKNKFEHRNLLLFWFLAAPLPAALANPSPHALRAITFLPLFSIFAAVGFMRILLLKNYAVRIFLVLSFIAVGVYSFVLYLHLYYVHEPRLKALDWQDGNRQAIEFIKPNLHNYNTVAMSSYYGQPYIFALFYTAYDPAKYQKDGSRQGFNKFEFFGPTWIKTRSGNALVVTPAWQGHPPKVLKQIYGLEGDLRYVISEEK